MDGVTERLARVATTRTCQLTHRGRKSGRPFEVTIWFLVDADTVYLTTMNMKRQWTQNVQVNRDVAIRIGSETFAGEARVVTEPSEMAEVVRLLKEVLALSTLPVAQEAAGRCVSRAFKSETTRFVNGSATSIRVLPAT